MNLELDNNGIVVYTYLQERRNEYMEIVECKRNKDILSEDIVNMLVRWSVTVQQHAETGGSDNPKVFIFMLTKTQLLRNN